MAEELEGKFPYEALESGRNVELFVSWYNTRKLKHAITVQWDDDFENNREKNIYLDL